MNLNDFDYHLPEQLIAQNPYEPRDHSRLLVLDRLAGRIEHRHFYDIADYLRVGDTLVFNDTKVIPARLIGTKHETGAKVEVFLLNRIDNDDWEVLVKPGKKARCGALIEFGNELKCEILASTDFGGRIVRFFYRGIFEEVLDRLGEIPLPPYIKEKLLNKERYQTVYAKEQGSAAAPTAGLHFTNSLIEKIKLIGVNIAYVTLHVGLGTFRPVSVENITEHKMHSEYYSLPQETVDIINNTKHSGGRVFAVGTTTVRTLETAGSSGCLSAKSGKTDIFIYPGYKFKVVDALVTNFHLPKSTLLMLVSALAGRNAVLSAYQEAVNNKYRFFSFGDAMLIL